MSRMRPESARVAAGAPSTKWGRALFADAVVTQRELITQGDPLPALSIQGPTPSAAGIRARRKLSGDTVTAWPSATSSGINRRPIAPLASSKENPHRSGAPLGRFRSRDRAAPPARTALILERFCRRAPLLREEPKPRSVRGLRDGDPRLCRSRTASHERRITSESCRSCTARGLVLRQIMPIVREGWGSLKGATDTDAERVSTGTAISGIKVTPMPALTIWTSVDRELASSASRGGDDCISQNDSA